MPMLGSRLDAQILETLPMALSPVEQGKIAMDVQVTGEWLPWPDGVSWLGRTGHPISLLRANQELRLDSYQEFWYHSSPAWCAS
jgi:hypothetical protein